MGDTPKIIEIKANGGFQEAGGGWSILGLTFTVDVTGKSKCTITSHSGVTVKLDGVVTSFTAGTPFDVLNKSTMIISQSMAQMQYHQWNLSASGIYIE